MIKIKRSSLVYNSPGTSSTHLSLLIPCGCRTEHAHNSSTPSKWKRLSRADNVGEAWNKIPAFCWSRIWSILLELSEFLRWWLCLRRPQGHTHKRWPRYVKDISVRPVPTRLLGWTHVEGGKSQVLPPTDGTHLPLSELLLQRAETVQLPSGQRPHALRGLFALSVPLRAGDWWEGCCCVILGHATELADACSSPVRCAQYTHRGSEFTVYSLVVCFYFMYACQRVYVYACSNENHSLSNEFICIEIWTMSWGIHVWIR